MKKLFFLLSLMIATTTFAKTDYTISKGSLHRSGWINVQALEVGEEAHMKINYQVNPKRFIPGFFKKYLSGNHTEKLPKEFMNERAYLDLERDGKLEIKDAFVYHKGRVNYGRYTNAHKVFIVAKNGKSEITAIYHPIITDAGWAAISLTIKKIPVMGTYNLKAIIKK